MIDASKVAARFPHGLRDITVLREPESCPLCKLPMMLWQDGEHPVCFTCACSLEGESAKRAGKTP